MTHEAIQYYLKVGYDKIEWCTVNSRVTTKNNEQRTIRKRGDKMEY